MQQILHHTRYIILGMMDGVLIILSLLLASLLSPEVSSAQLIKLSLAVGVGIFMSDFLGAYYAETAEVHRKFASMERRMGVKGGYFVGTRLHESEQTSVWQGALTNSFSALLGCVIPALPLIVFHGATAVYTSIYIALAMLFILGAYLGRLSKENILASGLKLIIITLLIVLFNVLIGKYA